MSSVSQDEQGYVWMPSDKGVTKFNGRYLKTFTQKDGLPSNDVFSIYALDGNQCWITDYAYAATYILRDTVYTRKLQKKGAYCNRKPALEKKQYFNYKGNVINHGNGRMIYAWRNGYIFSLGIDSFLKRIPVLYKHIPERFKNIDPEYRIINSNFCINGHQVAFSHDSTLLLYDFNTQQFDLIKNYEAIYNVFSRIHIKPQFFANYFLYLSPYQKQLKFIDLNTFQRDSIDLLLYDRDYENSIIHKNEGDSVFSITSQNGTLIRINKNLDVTDTLKWHGQEKVNYIFKDKQANYWASTYNDGIFLISQYFTGFKKQALPGISSRIISMYEHEELYYLFDNESRLFITDKDYNIKKRVVFPVVHKAYPEIKKFWFIPDIDSGYYIASAFGTYYMFKNHEFVVANSRHLHTSFKDYSYDPENRNLIIGNSSGMVVLTPYPYLKYYEYKNKGSEERVLNVSKGPDGKYWGTGDIGVIAKVGIQDSSFAKIELNKKIAFSCFAGNVFFFSVEGYGIYRYDLSDNKIVLVHPDDNFQYYKQGKGGIWVANERYIALIATNSTDHVVKKKYLNLKGLLYSEVHDIAECKDAVFLICDNGIVKLPGNDFTYADTAFTKSAYLSSIVIGNDKPVYFLKEDSVYSYTYTPEGLSLRFTCNSTSFLGEVSYRYFIEGSSHAWQSTREDVITYPSLSPGTYGVQVKAKVNNLSLETDVATFTLIVQPRWWQSIWFKIFIVLLLLSTVVVVFFLRVKRIKNREQKQAELSKKMASLELTALQSQMNPHFIFNSLTSIQSFINTNRSEDADKLLRQFSLLVRLYLEFSRSKLITIEQELKSLHIYTDIERLRFSNKFKTIFKLRNQATETLDHVYLPPMLVQPIVENAINHGLYHRNDNEGVLKIYFLVNSVRTIVIVDDNGIGREAARKLRNKMFPSIGNQLINDRIQILNESGRANAEMKIIDKYDKNGDPAGTRVVLTIINIDYDKSDNS